MSAQSNSVGGYANQFTMPNSGQASPAETLGNVSSNGPGGGGMPGSGGSGNYSFALNPTGSMASNGAAGPGAVQSPTGGPAGATGQVPGGNSMGGVNLNQLKALIGGPMNAQAQAPNRGTAPGPRMKTQAAQFSAPVLSSNLAGASTDPGMGMLQLLQKYRVGMQ